MKSWKGSYSGSSPTTNGDAIHTQLIGGFIWGYYRPTDAYDRPLGTNNQPFGTNWQTNIKIGIVPNSVWTLLHRPKCSPEYMVYLDNNLWGDIIPVSNTYLDCSVLESSLPDNTEYGEGYRYMSNNIRCPTGKPRLTDQTIPVTGVTYPVDGTTYEVTSGHKTSAYNSYTPNSNGNLPLNWFGFIELASIHGKRLPTYMEFCKAAFGSPQPGSNNTITTYNFPIPSIADAYTSLSSYNVFDLVGNVWKWCSDIMSVEKSTSSAWQSMAATLRVGGILDVGISCGDVYAPTKTSIRALVAGGCFNSNTDAGRRAANISYHGRFV